MDAEFLASIRADSQTRRAAPLDFVIEFLESIWLGNTPAEAVQQWRVKVDEFPWYAADALACLAAVSANPPEDLASLLRQHGGIVLTVPDEHAGQPRPAGAEAYRNWLMQTRAVFQAIFDQA